MGFPYCCCFRYTHLAAKCQLKGLCGSRAVPYATGEKALLDLLYLYPFYNTESELLEIRLDPDILRENLDRRTWRSMGKRFLCARLEKRMQLLEKVYDL